VRRPPFPAVQRSKARRRRRASHAAPLLLCRPPPLPPPRRPPPGHPRTTQLWQRDRHDRSRSLSRLHSPPRRRSGPVAGRPSRHAHRHHRIASQPDLRGWPSTPCPSRRNPGRVNPERLRLLAQPKSGVDRRHNQIDDRLSPPRGLEFLYDPHRLNVATSRARAMAIIVASPEIPRPWCTTPRQMQIVNATCEAWERSLPSPDPRERREQPY
jgi:hypothetical protein